MPGEAKALYAKHTRYRTKPTIEEMVSIVEAEVRRHSAVFLVVDALDECPEDGRVRATFVERLQYILTATTSTDTKVRLLVTSRLAKNIFPDANETEIRATDPDVKRLICQRIKDGLSDDDEISQSIRQNEALKNALVRMIVERAGKMYVLTKQRAYAVAGFTDQYRRFLIAKLQLDSLATKTTLRSLREAIEFAPKDLDELYIQAWNRINNQNSDSRHDAKKALCWLSCSFRQLRVQELRHALAIREGDRIMNEENLMNFDRLVRSCAGLVTVDKESQIVRLIHQTAQDFFDGRSGEYFLDAHTQLARTCVTYLSFNEFAQGPCEVTSFRPFDEDHSIKGPIAASRFLPTRLKRNPFMDYAAHHWGDHARGEATERTLERE